MIIIIIIKNNDYNYIINEDCEANNYKPINNETK